MSDFVIRKDIYGNWWHDYNNDATKINISDFEALIDDVQNTFIIQCKNGSNVPTMGVSIVNVKVINSIISPTPIAFSGAVGLKNLLTTLNYTPYVNGGTGGGESLAETLAIDNKTNGIPIVSNNGNGYAYVNDEQTVIGNDFGGTKKITMNEDSFAIETNVRATIDGKGLNINTTTDGLGLPRLTTTQMNAIAFPTEGMIVWNTTETATYQYNGTVWVLLGGGAVDSVNGQTGVVVLDAADVGAEPTKGSDDNYVTDAQLVVIANTSNTNSGDNATNTKYEAVARTGAVVAFDVDAVYNSIASPSSSNLTDDLTGARLKIVQKIYHNAGTAPTVPAGWVKKGTGNYVTSTLNIIYAEWSVGTTVEYWITQ